MYLIFEIKTAMLAAPVNNLIVSLDKKFYDTVTFASGVTLAIDPSWHPEEFAMMRARVVSIPGKIDGELGREGMTLGMQPGDDVLVRYDLVFSYIDQPENDTPIYKNLILLEGRQYWKCDISKVFAYIRDGKTLMINGYVMCDIIKERNPIYSAFIEIPGQNEYVVQKGKMTVRHIGPPLDGELKLSVQAGDIVFANPAFVQTYQIDEEEFYIIRQSHILAKLC